MRRALQVALCVCSLALGISAAQEARAPHVSASPPDALAPHDALAPQAAPSAVQARLACEPARAEIGQPVEWILTVEHPRAISVKLPEKAPLPDGTWVALGDRSVVNDAAAGSSEMVRTRARWRVMSLASGARAVPAIELHYEEHGAQRTLATAPIVLEVRGELGPDEDAPRPMKGFRPPPAGADGTPHWPWILGLLLAVCAILVWIRRRSRKEPAAIAVATPLERLAELERAIGTDPDAGREITYALSMLLREAVDAFVREGQAALTDLDWTERTERDERVPAGVRSACARLLCGSEEVKYAQRVPTRFAVEEMLRDARNALEALASAPAPAAAESGHGPARDADKEAA
jgi:hypothetical protein